MCIRDRRPLDGVDGVEFGGHFAQLLRTHPFAHLGQYAAQARRVGAAGGCLLYTSDAADERSRVDLGGGRFIKKKKKHTSVVG